MATTNYKKEMQHKRAGSDLEDPRPTKRARTADREQRRLREPVTCPTCNMTGITDTVVHNKQYHGGRRPKRFFCQLCDDFVYCHPDAHRREKHVECKHCHKWCRDAHDLHIHSDIVQCRYCDQEVSTCTETIRAHVGRLHYCGLCKNSFRDPVAHRQAVHVRCGHCAAWFRDPAALAQHAQIEVCSLCDGKVSSCTEKIGHHLQQRHHQCGNCRRWFRTMEEHKAHTDGQSMCSLPDCKMLLCPGQRVRHAKQEHKLERCVMLGCQAHMPAEEVPDHLAAEHTCDLCADGILHLNVADHRRRMHTAAPPAADNGYRLVKCGAHQAAHTSRAIINGCRRKGGCCLYLHGCPVRPGARRE